MAECTCPDCLKKLQQVRKWINEHSALFKCCAVEDDQLWNNCKTVVTSPAYADLEESGYAESPLLSTLSANDLLDLGPTRQSKPYAVDSSESGLDMRSRSISPNRKPTARNRSASPLRKSLRDLQVGGQVNEAGKPPFVVRKLDEDLTMRMPGFPTTSQFPANDRSSPLPPAGRDAVAICIRDRDRDRDHERERERVRARKKPAASPTRRSAHDRSTSRTHDALAKDHCVHCTYGKYADGACTVCRLYKRYLGCDYWGHRYAYHPNSHRHPIYRYDEEAYRQERNAANYANGQASAEEDELAPPCHDNGRYASSSAKRGHRSKVHRSSQDLGIDEEDRLYHHAWRRLSPYRSRYYSGRHWWPEPPSIDTLESLEHDMQLARHDHYYQF